MAYRRQVPPVPPPLGGIVVDGSNVVATSKVHVLQRLDLVTGWFEEWRSDLAIRVFLDVSTAKRCRPEVQDVLRARCADVTPDRPRYAVVPPGEFADEHVLRDAAARHALVVSNDRYFDWEDLRANVLTVQFKLAGDALHVYEDATWFRSPGTAERVPMTVLRELR